MIAPWRLAVAVAVAVAAAVGAASLIGPPESVVRERPGRVEPVLSTTLVCPYVGGESEGSGDVGVLALAGVETGAETVPPADGEVTPLAVEPLLGAETDAEPLLTLAERGRLAVERVETDEPVGLAIRSGGALAPGVVAEQSVRTQGPDERGLADTACTEPAREHWFVGASGQVGRRALLVLSNSADTPAVADIVLWDEAGPVDAPGADDLGVPARGQRVVPLDALAPDSARVGLQVTVSEGRLAAGVQVRESDGLKPLGTTAVPAAAAPSTEVLVPGVPGAGQRLLQVLAPGDSDAIVSLQLLGPEGPFSPVDQDVVTVPAGSVLEIALTEAAGEAPVAVRLASDVPVTAAARVVQTPDDGEPEVAYTAATPSLPAAAASLLGRAGDDLATSLLLTSVGEQAAAAEVIVVDGDGTEVAQQDVEVPAGTTRAVELAAPEGRGWVTVVVRPREPGTLAGARLVLGQDDDGALIDLVPLLSPRVSVRVPEVAGELPTGLSPPTPAPLQ